MNEYEERLENADSFADIFELVKDVVMQKMNASRGGLDLGLMELGNTKEGWLGAFYPAGSNIIVMNKTPLRRISETKPELMKPYVFMVLLHEYLHSLGYLDEGICRRLAYDICLEIFGYEHTSTEMAQDMKKFIPYIAYPDGFPQTDKDFENIQIIEGFDREADFYLG